VTRRSPSEELYEIFWPTIFDGDRRADSTNDFEAAAEPPADVPVDLERFIPQLRRWAHGRIPEALLPTLDTDDLVQETLVDAIQRWRTVPKRVPTRPGALQAYLRQALLNRLRDEIRRQGVHEEMMADTLQTSESPLEQAIQTEAWSRYHAALKCLTPEDRAAVIGRIEKGLSYGELAQTLHMPTEDAARLRVSRALRRVLSKVQRSSSEPDQWLARWLPDCQDPWLRDIATRRMRSENRWDQTVAYGMCLRLWRMPPDRARDLVMGTIRGRVDEPTAVLRGWARRLESLDRQRIERLAFERARYLEQELAKDDVAWDDSELVRRFVSLAHLRDDLESVLSLFDGVELSARVTTVCGVIDTVGRAFRFNVPIDPNVQDERLERVSLSDPTAWWGSLVYDVPTF
jgi:RNA polymerase sigma factor (sigma-70 family)